ncbi:MAG TPA: Mur ligase domain-containing protein [Candidatus Saccharimonadales bacterium]|jgi:UDP-N-acetylmuramate--alanine ligase
MHIFFSGIGGTGLGPLALIAHQAGYDVSGSDKQDSSYIHYLREQGITNIEIGQTIEQIEAAHERDPIDWYVYSSAVAIENPDAPEFRFCHAKHIRTSKRDVLLNTILADKNLKLIAIAGTHGKTTTTAMAVWLLKRLNIPVSYSVGAKITFGEMGHYEPQSQYFVYEADEFDRNFLAFQPFLSIITGIAWDHHDIYPTFDSYKEAFREFIFQSGQTVMWQQDYDILGVEPSPTRYVLDKENPEISRLLSLPGPVNREDAWEVAAALQLATGIPFEQLLPHLDAFPGVSRRFEQVLPHLYSEYAHTPPKIRGALAIAAEVARPKNQNVVVVYEGLHNTRQHFIKEELKTLFDGVTHLYIVPTYLAREDKTLPLLSPADLKKLLSEDTQAKTTPSELNADLRAAIQQHLDDRDIVVCISAGGGGSLDEWLRKEFVKAAEPDTPVLTVPHTAG